MSVPSGAAGGAFEEEPLARVPMSWEAYLALPEDPFAEWVDGEAVIRMAPNTRMRP